MARDRFAAFSDSPTFPAARAFAIVPHDTATFTETTKAIYVGTGGALTVRLAAADQDITFRNLADGSILDIRAVAVRASGTDAADLVGLV